MKKNIASTNDKHLSFFLNEVREHSKGNLKRAIFFGSRVRGDYDSHSDYDLILIFKEVTPELKDYLDELQGEMLFNYNLVFSAFPFSQSKLKHLRFEPFFINARREGVEV